MTVGRRGERGQAVAQSTGGAGAGGGADAVRRARLPRHRHPAARRRRRAVVGLALPLHGHQGGPARRDHAQPASPTCSTAAERVAGSHPDPRERLVALVGSTSAPTRRRRSRPGSSTTRCDALSATARAEVVALRDRYEALWQARRSRTGSPRGASASARLAVVRRALLEMCSGVARWWTPDGALDLDALAEEYAALALRLVDAEPA